MPEIAELLAKAGQLLAVGQPGEVHNLCRLILKKHPSDPEILYRTGLLAYQSGSLVLAEDCFRQALSFLPASPILFHCLGVVLKDQGKLAEAIACLKNAISLQPDFAVAHYDLGNTYYATREFGNAIASFRQAIACKPDYAMAYNNLGITLNVCGHHEEAITILSKALKIEPHNSMIWHNLAQPLKAHGSHEEAINALKKAIELQSEFFPGYSTLGLILYERGDLQQACQVLEQALVLKPQDVSTLNNIGLVYLALKRPAQALGYFQQALLITRELPQLYYNLGLSLFELGRLDEAIVAMREALVRQPEYGEALANLAVALHETGEIDEAIDVFKKAVQCNPDSGDVWFNFSLLWLKSGNFIAAVSCCRRAIAIDPGNLMFQQQLITSLHQLAPASLDAEGARDVENCLALNGVSKQPLAQAGAYLLEQDPGMAELLRLVNSGLEEEFIANIRAGNSTLHHSSLLLHLLMETFIVSPVLEKILSAIRRSLLKLILADELTAPRAEQLRDFVCGLALQCFNNEYVYFQNEDEIEGVHRLKQRLETMHVKSGEIPLIQLALVGAYLPLWQLNWSQELPGQEQFQKMPCIMSLITRQILEPLEELRLQPGIMTLSGVNDNISRAVRIQYEENPYPRWLEAGSPGTARPFLTKLYRLYPYLARVASEVPSAPEILIAGCGTGRQAIVAAQSYVDARITALDLSLASLTYGKRKAAELGIENITFYQGDILQVKELHRSFDVIECSGVLHHMRDPLEGWRTLVDCLRPGGYMKIGLYSELARKEIVAARNYIHEHGYAATPDDIRQCRQDILALPSSDPLQKIVRLEDFHSLSQCRDMIFHVQEHRFTIPRIAAALAALNLVFLGFIFDRPDVITAYQQRFPGDQAVTSLENWHQFELEYPDTFIGMYQFWCASRA